MTTTDTTRLVVPCEVYSRIVGYLRPTRNWNKGKAQEFKDRRTYRLPSGLETGLEADIAAAVEEE